MKPIIWSYGGGVQSVAMLVLIIQGRLPKPERVVMADTGRERQAVWDYIDEVAGPQMERLGLELEVIPHSYSTVDLMSNKGAILIPVYFPSKNGGKGKLRTWCSNRWKKEPVRRYLREQGYGPKNPIIQWFGMSLDETHRMRKSDRKWIAHYYPLCQDTDVRLRRHECRLLIERHGWPQPPSSACWMCPNRDNHTWQQMKDNEPDDFAKAARFERVITGVGWGDIYLHRDIVPIDQVVFEKPSQPGLFDDCSYSCFT